MEPPSLPRFEATQRRDFLKRAAALGALALVPGLASCSTKKDEDVFSDASTTTVAGASSSTTTADSASSDDTSTTAAASGSPLPDGGAVEVAFTYTADGNGFGPARNPFIAVWVETPDGDLVANVSVWYNPPKGERWINNLASWYAAESSSDGADLAAKTGATRPAGAYTVAWDGTDASGARAPQGEYVVFIESAREHGTHSLTSVPVTLGASGLDAVDVPPNGELSAATLTYRV